MRALFSSVAAVGHAFPMVATARALADDGHDVLFATSGGALAVADAGIAVADLTPPGFDPQQAAEQLRAVRPDLYARMHQVQNERQTDLRDTADWFAATAGFVAPALLAAATAWEPDVVVGSFLDGAGLLVAARLGLPFVRHNADLARTTGIDELFARHMASAFAQMGVAGLPASRVTLDVAPPSMVDVSPQEWPMRHVPYNGVGAADEQALPAPTGRPRVAVTLGTIVPGLEGLDQLGRIVRACGAVDAEFVVAAGAADTSALGAVPDNVRLAGWLPMQALLPTCAAVVHHGGGGTTMAALATGVPQLIVTGGAGRHVHAMAVAARGVGIAPDDGVVDAPRLERLLTDGSLRAAAGEVRDEMAAMPGPDELVPHLVEFVRARPAA